MIYNSRSGNPKKVRHLEVASQKVSYNSTLPNSKSYYSELLKDSRWQKKRLELLAAANWECCGSCENQNDNPTLHVHHKVYLRNTKPWEYEDWAYKVLCDECHKKVQELIESAHIALAKYSDLTAIASVINKMPTENAAQLTTLLWLAVENYICTGPVFKVT